MTQKLDQARTASLVREAARIHGKGEASSGDRLEDVIKSEREREEFRSTIVTLVRSQNFWIEANKIPIHPKTTLGEISQVVAMSALPGESESGEPETEEPKAPEPEETTRHPKQQRQNKRFEEIG